MMRAPHRAVAAAAVLGLLATACGAAPGRVAGTVIAGPTCPAATGAPSPACTPEPLAGVPLTVVRASDATVVGGTLVSATGVTVAGVTTDPAGAFSVRLDPGRYYVYGPAIVGLTTPPAVLFDVSPASSASVTILYGTGIR